MCTILLRIKLTLYVTGATRINVIYGFCIPSLPSKLANFWNILNGVGFGVFFVIWIIDGDVSTNPSFTTGCFQHEAFLAGNFYYTTLNELLKKPYWQKQYIFLNFVCLLPSSEDRYINQNMFNVCIFLPQKCNVTMSTQFTDTYWHLYFRICHKIRK